MPNLIFNPQTMHTFLPRRMYKGGIERRSVVVITQDCELSAKFKEPVYICAEAQCSERDNFNKRQGRAIALQRIHAHLSRDKETVAGVYAIRHSELFDTAGQVRMRNAITPISHVEFPAGTIARLGDLLCKVEE